MRLAIGQSRRAGRLRSQDARRSSARRSDRARACADRDARGHPALRETRRDRVHAAHARDSRYDMAEARVGPERIKGAYAWRKLLNARARLAGGSDFPVELANPFHGLYAAVTRQDRNGRPPGGWYGGEKLTREKRCDCLRSTPPTPVIWSAPWARSSPASRRTSS